MPTPKQVRHHFGRLKRTHDMLQSALNEAHYAGVIAYDKDKYREEGPCYVHGQTWERILNTTEKQLAQAMRREIYES